MAWEWWLYPSRTGYWQARTAKKITFKNCVPWHLRSTFPRSTLIYFLQVLSESEKGPKCEKGRVRKKLVVRKSFAFVFQKLASSGFVAFDAKLTTAAANVFAPWTKVLMMLLLLLLLLLMSSSSSLFFCCCCSFVAVVTVVVVFLVVAVNYKL